MIRSIARASLKETIFVLDVGQVSKDLSSKATAVHDGVEMKFDTDLPQIVQCFFKSKKTRGLIEIWVPVDYFQFIQPATEPKPLPVPVLKE